MARYGTYGQLLRQERRGFPDWRAGRVKLGQHFIPGVPEPYQAPPLQEPPKYDIEAALAELGARPTMAAVERAPRGGVKDIIPMIIAGIADALAVRGGRSADNVGRIRQLGEYYRDQDYQDRLRKAAMEFEGKKDQFGWNLAKLQLRRGAAERAQDIFRGEKRYQEDVARQMGTRREDILRAEKDKAFGRGLESERHREALGHRKEELEHRTLREQIQDELTREASGRAKEGFELQKRKFEEVDLPQGKAMLEYLREQMGGSSKELSAVQKLELESVKSTDKTTKEWLAEREKAIRDDQNLSAVEKTTRLEVARTAAAIKEAQDYGFKAKQKAKDDVWRDMTPDEREFILGQWLEAIEASPSYDAKRASELQRTVLGDFIRRELNVHPGQRGGKVLEKWRSKLYPYGHQPWMDIR